jgi:hypothetical protein
MSPILEDRLSQLAQRPILHGAHASPDDGMCIMEAVAWVAGEPWSDHPKCACPVISTFLRSWNDAITDDAERTTLMRPLVAKLVGSKSTKAVEQRRADLALDWLIRTHTPAWLDLGDETLKPHAAAIRALPPLVTKAALIAAQPTLTAANNAAAARAAAWAAAWDAAWDAARDAARDAAWDAARAAAWDAARAAAWDAAWDAARAAALKVDIVGLTYRESYDAVYSACVARLAPTRATLERSAIELIDRMLAER